MLRGRGGVRRSLGGGVSQVNAALSAIGRHRGVLQLYCRKSRLSGSRNCWHEGLETTENDKRNRKRTCARADLKVTHLR